MTRWRGADGGDGVGDDGDNADADGDRVDNPPAPVRGHQAAEHGFQHAAPGHVDRKSAICSSRLVAPGPGLSALDKQRNAPPTPPRKDPPAPLRGHQAAKNWFQYAPTVRTGLPLHGAVNSSVQYAPTSVCASDAPTWFQYAPTPVAHWTSVSVCANSPHWTAMPPANEEVAKEPQQQKYEE